MKRSIKCSTTRSQVAPRSERGALCEDIIDQIKVYGHHSSIISYNKLTCPTCPFINDYNLSTDLRDLSIHIEVTRSGSVLYYIFVSELLQLTKAVTLHNPLMKYSYL